MCARYIAFTEHTNPVLIADRFGLVKVPTLSPRYNVAPSQLVPAVGAKANGRRGMAFFLWGFVPHWEGARHPARRRLRPVARPAGEARPPVPAAAAVPGRWDGGGPGKPGAEQTHVRGAGVFDPALLAAIAAHPDDEARWLALAAWLRDEGRHDEAAAVRAFWPALRDSLAAGRSLESALGLLRRHAGRLGRRARECEDRVATEPEPRR
jgi:uncharacterized protein (TIGR02996 family)